jgi:hypothetical protein
MSEVAQNSQQPQIWSLEILGIKEDDNKHS